MIDLIIYLVFSPLLRESGFEFFWHLKLKFIYSFFYLSSLQKHIVIIYIIKEIFF